MTTAVDLRTKARTLMRDFPKFFTTTLTGNGAKKTFKLDQVNVVPTSVVVTLETATPQVLTLTTHYSVDERDGYIRFVSAPADGVAITVEGDYCTWFIDADLLVYVNMIISDHKYNRPQFSLATLDEAEVNIMAIGVVAKAYWSLLAEISRDIDVRMAEGTDIPATQRFQQIWGLVQYWQKQYEDGLKALNLGIHSIEVGDLRRISSTTGRLVPLYESKEYDDISNPVRKRTSGIDAGGVLHLHHLDIPKGLDYTVTFTRYEEGTETLQPFADGTTAEMVLMQGDAVTEVLDVSEHLVVSEDDATVVMTLDDSVTDTLTAHQNGVFDVIVTEDGDKSFLTSGTWYVRPSPSA